MQIIKVCLALTPLLVLRGIHTWLETHRLDFLIPKERMLRLHKLVGHTAMVAMLMHVFAHCFTYYRAATGNKGPVSGV